MIQYSAIEVANPGETPMEDRLDEPRRFVDMGNGLFFVPEQSEKFERYVAEATADLTDGPQGEVALSYSGGAWQGQVGPISARPLAELSAPRYPALESTKERGAQISAGDLMEKGDAMYWPATVTVLHEGRAAGLAALDNREFADEASFIAALRECTASRPPRALRVASPLLRDIALAFRESGRGGTALQ